MSSKYERQVLLVLEAQELGCVIECVQFNNQPDRWYWSHGKHARSSNDHYDRSFNTAGEAAKHFLQSREGQSAKRQKQ